MDIKVQLTEFINGQLLSGFGQVGEDDSLLAEGMIDSLGMLRLVDFIEETCGVKVPHEDLVIDNFRTIGAISAYLAKD